ncbi:hypothetical protein, variant [Blastomyces dermatitidis ER-3]|uniref:Uncharacterized protein n=2 Tax=Ajellomyces dermatitidis TaxID=5039 RepID=F2TS68_AJEDA|nr:uncharacterized protein BDCG_05220 [Blastomyces dermatitidis ER-3]XP_045281179.1 hypothetical protein, variant [Blastomyces dermatitidis ER-3]EGE86081.1 hypothetical protein BDDG_09026 [Blastomyces dermatitidis ATCC 18188]OAT01451.1 hypothetical protein BDCG_05220 [Blastomyces dermatitidis ER-3]OAT01452.1 hypothetical protein, variant [Blastomyces dermatitidis ER-3]
MPGSDESPSKPQNRRNHHRSNNNSLPLFQFPTLPVAGAPPVAFPLQPDAEPMTSDNHRCERPSSSLSESWATLSGSDIYSEDDSRSEQTDTASLVGRSVPDDVTSLEGRDDDDSEADSVDVHSYYSEPTPLLPFPSHMREQSLENSGATIKAPYQLGSDSIKFVEPDAWPENETIELKHTIKVFNEAETPEFLRTTLAHDLGDGHLSVTVQQAMSKRGLDLTKPFRALYIGAPDFKHIILDKMGDVLVAGSDDDFNHVVSGDSSRFHVVPASFGTGASPNYAELLPIHVQLIVDECVSAMAQGEGDKPSTITITLKNRNPCSSAWTGSDYEIQSATPWDPPDLAIFFIAQDDSPINRKTLSLCHTFMKRHGVPSMVISENPMWTKQNPIVPLDYQSLHVCLESRQKDTGESQVLGRFPIDLKTFESIAPGQLNRNLASLSGHHSSKAITKLRETPEKDTTTPIHVRGWESLVCIKWLPDGSSELFLFGTPYTPEDLARVYFTAITSFLGLLMLVIICGPLHSFIFVDLPTRFPSLPISPLVGESVTTTAHLPPRTTTGSTVETTSLMPLSVSDLILPDCTGKDSFDVDTYISKLTRRTEKQGGEPDKFQVHVIGDCHVIIRLPPRLASRRKSPKFDVTVTRTNQQIPFDRARLFDGVYTLRLPREDAYGPMNISITTKSKPIIEQVTEVDFGMPWLKIANWKKAAQKLSAQLKRDLNIASAGLTVVYNRMSADLLERSDALRGETESVGRASLQRALEATNVILAKSKQLSDEVTRLTQDGLMASTALLRQKLSTVNTDVVQFVNEKRYTIEKEARRLFQYPASVHDFNFARRLTDNAQRVKRSPGMAAAQKHATHLWQLLRSGPNNELTNAVRWPKCETGRRQKVRRGKLHVHGRTHGSWGCGRR